jgi:zinc transporter 1
MQKSTRIKILLGVDTAFFLLEIIVGYAVHSLALVADSFHMVRLLSQCDIALFGNTVLTVSS